MAHDLQDGTLHNLYAIVHLGLVTGPRGPHGQHAQALVQRQPVIGAIQIGFVAAAAVYAGPGVSGEDRIQNPSEEFEGADMRDTTTRSIMHSTGGA